jgi:hypothetical protein
MLAAVPSLATPGYYEGRNFSQYAFVFDLAEQVAGISN